VFFWLARFTIFSSTVPLHINLYTVTCSHASPNSEHQSAGNFSKPVVQSQEQNLRISNGPVHDKLIFHNTNIPPLSDQGGAHGPWPGDPW
jgi:hypothetical protein